MAKALVIDDEADARAFVRAILESEDWEVAEAEDGEAGVAAAKADKPDLIVMTHDFYSLYELRPRPTVFPDFRLCALCIGLWVSNIVVIVEP